MKNFGLVISAGLLVIAGVGCGGKKKGNDVVAQQCVNQFTRQPVDCATPGAIQAGQGQYQFPGGPGGMVNIPVQCPSGQFKLRNQCVFAQDLTRACMMVGGQMLNIQGRALCMNERAITGYSVRASNFCASDYSTGGGSRFRLNRTNMTRVHGDTFNSRANFVGEGCASYTISAPILPQENLVIAGRVNPMHQENDWMLTVKKGYTIVGSARSGDIINEAGENFMMTIPAGMAIGTTAGILPQNGYPQNGYPQMNYPQNGYPQNGYPQMGYPQYPGSQMGMHGMGYSQPIVLEAQVRGRNNISVRLAAYSCEDGSGNPYSCY